MKGQRKCSPDNVSGNSLRSDERSAVTRSEIAAVERREARLPRKRQAGAFLEVPHVVAPIRRSASLREAKERTGRKPGKEDKTG